MTNDSRLYLNLLGAFELKLVKGSEPILLPTDKSRGLLAFLALEPDQHHRREQLAGLFWPDWPEDVAKRHLRQALYLVRQRIDAAEPGLSDLTFEISRQTVLLHGQVLTSDFDHFNQAEQADFESLTSSGKGIDQVSDQLGVYTAEFLAGFTLPDSAAFDEWLTLTRERLSLSALKGLDQLTAAHQVRGEYEQARVHATRQLSIDPLRESAHRQLMVALAASGQRNEALTQYESCRLLLQDELGVDPDPETQAVFLSIKAGRVGPGIEGDDTDRQDSAHSTSTVLPPLHFPVQTTPFVGRRDEMDRVWGFFQEGGTPLLTVTGSGGIGKTRLAVEAVQRFPDWRSGFSDGIHFISLESVESGEMLLINLANQLGLTFKGQSDHFAQLVDLLASKDMLIVLDGFEHLTSEAGLLAQLLSQVAGVKLLVTSREPLNLRAETRLLLEGLAYPKDDAVLNEDLGLPDVSPDYDAIRLFEQTAARVQPGFSASPEAQQAIARICQLVHGVPLAIEIAATWVRMYDVENIALEIGRNLDFLVTPYRDLPARHQSLRAVFDHSWDLLSPREQRALTQVSVFSGGFELDAAQAITEASVLDLASLLDKSMLQRAPAGRYLLRGLLRQFLTENHTSTEGQYRMYQRHTNFYLSFVHDREPHLRAGDQLEALNQLERELSNIQIAWEWALARAEVNLIDRALEGIFYFFDTRSRFHEGELMLSRALKALSNMLEAGDRDRVRARLQARLAWFRFHRGAWDDGMRLFKDSLEELRRLDLPAETIFLLNYLGAMERHQHAYDAARDYLLDGLVMAEQHQDQHGISIALNILGQIDSLEGKYERAREYCTKALALKREIGDRWGMTFSLTYLGRVELQTQDFDRARTLFEESMALSREFGDLRGVAFSLQNLGDTSLAQGDRSAAEIHYGQSLTIYQDIGSQVEAEKTREKLQSLR